MSEQKFHDLSFDDFDEIANPRPEYSEFDDVVDRAVSRRGFLAGVVSVGTASFLTGTALGTGTASAAGRRFGFTPVAANTLDTITVPQGFNWHVAMKWGDELFENSVAFDEETRGDAASQALAFGDNNDGMALFYKNGRSIFAVNNEYVNRSIIFGNRESGLPETDDDVKKGMMGHGVTICEIAETDGEWSIVRGSEYNRKITPDVEFEITGPAAGHDLMKTAADPSGSKSLGTWNNCGNGETPWGTYLVTRTG